MAHRPAGAINATIITDATALRLADAINVITDVTTTAIIITAATAHRPAGAINVITDVITTAITTATAHRPADAIDAVADVITKTIVTAIAATAFRKVRILLRPHKFLTQFVEPTERVCIPDNYKRSILSAARKVIRKRVVVPPGVQQFH